MRIRNCLRAVIRKTSLHRKRVLRAQYTLHILARRGEVPSGFSDFGSLERREERGERTLVLGGRIEQERWLKFESYDTRGNQRLLLPSKTLPLAFVYSSCICWQRIPKDDSMGSWGYTVIMLSQVQQGHSLLWPVGFLFILFTEKKSKGRRKIGGVSSLSQQS